MLNALELCKLCSLQVLTLIFTHTIFSLKPSKAALLESYNLVINMVPDLLPILEEFRAEKFPKTLWTNFTNIVSSF
jgi:hypothetical protein